MAKNSKNKAKKTNGSVLSEKQSLANRLTSYPKERLRQLKNEGGFKKLIKRKHVLSILFVLPYIFFCALYMGPGFTHCSDSIYGFGDSTAGPIWRNSIKPTQPIIGGYENLTNYPKGETLYTPVNYASVAQTTLLNTSARIVGPVCAYNLSNVIGYLTTAIVMFAFIYYLIRNRWIAFIAGYAVSFTPYVQSKIGGHPSYAFGCLLIAALWLLLHVLHKRKALQACMLAVVLAICSYFDPYFILLVGTIIVPVTGLWVLWTARTYLQSRSTARSELKPLVRSLAIALALFTVLVAPLIYVRIRDADTITSSVGAVRGSVLAAAKQCSNMPQDYLLPDPLNIPFTKIVGSTYTARNIAHRHWCGFGESRVAISLTMLSVIALGGVILGWELLNRRLIGLGKDMPYNAKFVFTAIAAVGAAAFLIGLPPVLFNTTMPSGWIIKITETWRIYAREYMVLNISVVVLFAMILKFFSTTSVIKNRRVLGFCILIGLFGLVAAEYQINDPFSPPTFSYSRDVPQTYYDIKDNKDITSIAEYPLDRSGIEHDSIVYYLTMQTVHQKKLFNSAAITDTSENIHIAVKNVIDPQTLAALRYYGVKYVVIHGVKPGDIAAQTQELQVVSSSKPKVYSLNFVTTSGTDDVVLAKIVDGPSKDYVLTFKKGFVVNFNIMKTPLSTEFETVQDTVLEVTPLSGKPDGELKQVCFDAKMSGEPDVADLTVSINGVPQQTVEVGNSYVGFRLDAKEGDKILLHNSKGFNLRLHNLGCR